MVSNVSYIYTDISQIPLHVSGQIMYTSNNPDIVQQSLIWKIASMVWGLLTV